MKAKSIYSTVVSLLLSLFFTVATIYGQTNNHQSPYLNLITISTEKDHFLSQEAIWIFINFVNTTKDTLRINRSALREGLRVGAIQGPRVPKYLRGSGIPTSFVVPGDSLFALVDLNTYYGTRGGVYHGWRFIPKGGYRVYIKLPSYRITSDTVEITVSEPEGEELKALNLLTEGMKLSETVGGERKAAIAKAYKKFEELVEKYPHSLYAPKALDEAAGCYMYVSGEEEKALQKFRELLEKYPESPYYLLAIACIEVIYENDKDKAGALREMKELMKKHPNSKIADRVRRGIQYIEKW